MKTQVKDAIHIKVGYGVEMNDGTTTLFQSLQAVKMFVRENGLKFFFAYDKENRANSIRIKAIYMDRFRESDIEDRLIANKQQGGKSFFVQTFRDEREKDEELNNEYNGEEL